MDRTVMTNTTDMTGRNIGEKSQGMQGIRKIVFLALFTAASAVIQVVEHSLIPSAIPFRPGIANLVILIVIAYFGRRDALVVSIARSLIAALVTGRFLSVPFFLGLSGGIVSVLVMSALYDRYSELSVVGVSVLGAVTHNLTQVLVVYLFFIPTVGITNLIPFLGIMSLVTGLFTGFTARELIASGFIRHHLAGGSLQKRDS